MTRPNLEHCLDDGGNTSSPTLPLLLGQESSICHRNEEWCVA